MRSLSFERTILAAAFVMFIFILDFVAGSLFGFYESQQLRLTTNLSTIRTPSSISHHDNLPLVSAETIWGTERFTVTTNSLGFRDAARRTVPLETEKYRLLFIGDSFTEGLGVAYRDSFVGRIGAEIQEWAEVLNAAVSSYSPIIYHRKLEYLIESLGLEIHEVVVFLDISDIQDELIYRVDANGVVVRSDENEVEESLLWERRSSERRPLPDTRLRPTPDTRSDIFKRYLERHSIAGRTLAEIKRSFAPPPVPNSSRASWTFDDEVFAFYGEEGVEVARQHMDQLSALLMAHGIALTLVVYPWPEQIAAGDLDSRQVRIWREWSSTRQAGFVNLFPCFIGEGRPDWTTTLARYFVPGDVHWNKAGHALVASAFLAAKQGDWPGRLRPREAAAHPCAT